MATTVRSHAKINLGLGIGAPRADGFHGLVTLYQTLELYDRVTVTAKLAAAGSGGIRITSSDRRVPVDGRNTAWKMVEQALAALEIAAEVDIHIEKRLPIQGGLGAGSANAVAALVGLEVELGIAGPRVRSNNGSPQPGLGDKGLPRVGHPGVEAKTDPSIPDMLTSEGRRAGHPDLLSGWGRSGWWWRLGLGPMCRYF